MLKVGKSQTGSTFIVYFNLISKWFLIFWEPTLRPSLHATLEGSREHLKTILNAMSFSWKNFITEEIIHRNSKNIILRWELRLFVTQT